MISHSVFQLNVQQFQDFCRFDLSWGRGQNLSATLPYPESLTELYQSWANAYRSFYRSALRGRKGGGGSATLTVNWRAALVEAEASFLSEFHHWLRSDKLFEIREKIIESAVNQSAAEQLNPTKHKIDIFLTCAPIELARFPWEAWQISPNLAEGMIRIARTPINRREESGKKKERGKARILVILGDDTGLNFQKERENLNSLNGIADVVFAGWQPGIDIKSLKANICAKLTEPRGWDLLFFAGHSNETALTGGELAIAPGESIYINEISQQLIVAKQHGLQFAIFNSCNGLTIADSLINLGFSQVAVMREPIHNQVAQQFLQQFVKSLAQYKDVHDAMVDACKFIEQHRIDYPSAYLVPSLFRYPDTELFRLKPFGVWEIIKRWMPSKRELGWLLGFLLLSLAQPGRDLLLEPRIWVQAIYRQLTWQVPVKEIPPIFIVKIDNQSLKADNIQLIQGKYMDYRYLSKLVDEVSQREAKIIGIDYVLDKVLAQPDRGKQLRESVTNTVNKNNWLVFATQYSENQYSEDAVVSNKIADLNQIMMGNISFYDWYVELLPSGSDCSKTCPFAYLLALSYSLLNQESLPPDLPQPKLSQTNFRASVINPKNVRDNQTKFLSQLRFHPLTSVFPNFPQKWLQPIIDFSIPPDRVYDSISACELLETCPSQGKKVSNLKEKIVLIIPGGYPEAGVSKEGEDTVKVPLAVAFWDEKKRRELLAVDKGTFPKGNAHAYMIHHLLTQHLVVPVPDLWLILLAAFLGKGMTLILLSNPRHQKKLLWGLGGANAIYLIGGLQVYISASVLLPWLLPSVVFWNYLRLAFRRKYHG